MGTDGTSRLRSLSMIARSRLRPAAIGSILAVLAGWQLLSLSFSPYRFPGLGVLVGNVGIVLSGGTRFDPLAQFGATIGRVAVGFAVSLSLATVWGVLMGARSSLGEYLSGPLFVFLTVPSVVWAFVGVIWFGLTEFLVPVFVVILVVFPYLTVLVWEGMGDIDERLVEMARAVGASRAATWRHVYLPQLRPHLFGAGRIGLALSWKLALVAEVFGSSTGVGVAVKYHFDALENGMVIAWAVPMMVLIYGADRLLRRIQRWLTRWQPDTADLRGAIE